MNQETIVDHIVQNLAFDVEAVLKKISNRTTDISESPPLNVKIKVRKKDEIHMQSDLLQNSEDTSNAIKQIRLVNSDQTILTFDVFMEAKIEKKPQTKLHKHIINKLKPGICLGTEDDNECPYVPSLSYNADITEPCTVTRSNGTLKQTFTLSKNYPVSTQPRQQKWLFGQCKPGGCLDPPFSEDKYSYKPCIESGPEREQVEIDGDVESVVYNNRSPIKLHNKEAQSNERHSSILASGFFKKKHKSSDKSSNTKLPYQTDSIVDLYKVGSVTNSTSTHSNSIITYPPKITSDRRINDEKSVKTRESNESKRKKSFNDHSEPLFTRPKGINYVNEKDSFNPSDNNPTDRSSDATDFKNLRKESIQVPLSILPVSIPVPTPFIPNGRRPEETTTYDTIKTQDSNANFQDSVPYQDLQKEINSKDTNIRAQHLCSEISIDSIDGKPMEPLNKTTSIPSKANEATIPNEIDNQGLVTTILQHAHEIGSENNTEDTSQPHTNAKTKSLKFPAAVPTSLSESSPSAAEDSKTVNDLQVIDRQSTQSKQLFETKPTQKMTDKNLYEDSKNTPITIDFVNRVEKKYLTANATPNSQYSDIEVSDTENLVTDVPIITKITQDFNEKVEKLATRDDIKDNDTTASKYPEYLHTKDSSPDQLSDIENSVNEVAIIVEDIALDSGGKEIIDEIEKSATQNYVRDKDLTASNHVDKISDVFVAPDPGAYQTIESQQRDDVKDSQTILISELTLLQKNIEVKNKGMQEDSTDDDSNKMEHKDTDLSDHEDQKYTSSSNGPEYATDSVNYKKDVDEATEANNDLKIDSDGQTRFIDEKSLNVIAVPVIDNSEQIPNFKSQVKKVNSDTIFVDKSKITAHDFNPNRVAFPLHALASHGLIGAKSVVKERPIPSTFPEKNAEVLSSDKLVAQGQYTSTIKTALKKDTISVELGFHSYLNDNNERMLRTFDAAHAPKQSPSSSVTVLKSLIRISSNEIKIPVDSAHDMFIQIKKAKQNQNVSMSKSGFVNVVDNEVVKEERPLIQSSDDKMRNPKSNANKNIPENAAPDNATNRNIIEYYEKELIPLQLIIRDLRNEIDVLAAQQLKLREKMYNSSKSKLPRFVHSNKKCIGCLKK